MMDTETRFVQTIAELNSQGKDITFAELICRIWKGKIVEVYIGDTYEDIKYEDSMTKYAAVLIGRVIAAYAECIVLDCAYVDETKKPKELKYGSIVCLNERGIRTITEVDGTGLLKDTFLNSRDAKLVKNLMNKNE